MSATDATVIATFSRRMRLRLDDGEEVEARIKGKKLKPVCGDRVVAAPIDGERDWLITKIQSRRNELTRPNMRGAIEVLVANVDQLIVVAAASPKPDWFIIDRYLCAAELMHADGVVVFNKTDIQAAPDDVLAVYEKVGYRTLSCSAESDGNVDELATLLADKTAIIVGQSGVGKSSLINRLAEDSYQKIGDLSEKSGEGRHTTVNSVMIRLPTGGIVIDSPGVRDYAPALQSIDDAITGFREIRQAGNDCRFANCRHLREPGCAVKDAVENGGIDARRYESYRRAVALADKLNRDRY